MGTDLLEADCQQAGAMITGEDIRQVRLRRGITQTEMAEWINSKLGLHYGKAQVSHLEAEIGAIPRHIAAVFRDEVSVITGTDLRTENTQPAIVIAIANQKGGVGKTTTAVNLSYALAARGERTLLVDMDAQANATLWMGLDVLQCHIDKATILSVLLRDTPLREILKKPPDVDVPLMVAPSSIDLSSLDGELMSKPGREFILREKLQSVRTEFDFVVIDCGPTLTVATMNALSAADFVIIVTQTELLSTYGIGTLIEKIHEIKKDVNRHLKILGILPTMFKRQLRQDQEILADLMAEFAGLIDIYPPIAHTTSYPKSVLAGQITMVAFPNTRGINVYNSIAAGIARLRVRSEEGNDAE